MLFRVLALTLIFSATDILCMAAKDPKPACAAATLGKLWPDAANHDPAMRHKMAHCGELQLCTRGAWRYHWRALTVRLDQLHGGSQLAKPAGCETPDEPDQETRPLPSR